MITFKKFNKEEYSNGFVVTDKKLSKLYGIKGQNVFVLPCGEVAKSFFYAKKLCSWLLQRGAQKDDVVVAVGGGSVGDLVGFVASVYKRGVKLVHVPTTLVAQIDSAIGGKTALDLDGVKNAVGSFYVADTVIDVGFLKTLPEKQWKNGQGELIKYRMLHPEIDVVFAQGDVENTVRSCAQYKQLVCERDPSDKAERRILNFGHTVGHAMELCLGLSHGEAVANGLYYETLIACKLGYVDNAYLQRWQGEIEKIFSLKPITAQILQHTLHDKKNKDGKICVVLPQKTGFFEQYFSLEELTELLV